MRTSRSAVESDASIRFGALIIRREDVELLGRKPETGGTPTPPWVEFVCDRRSCGPEFRQTALKTHRLDERAVFWARRGGGVGMAGMANTQSVRAPPCGRILKALTGHDEAPGWPVRRGSCPAGPSATTGQRSAHGECDRARGAERPAARRSCGGPETWGSEGARPPASLRRGLTVWAPSMLLTTAKGRQPALGTPPKRRSGHPPGTASTGPSRARSAASSSAASGATEPSAFARRPWRRSVPLAHVVP